MGAGLDRLCVLSGLDVERWIPQKIREIVAGTRRHMDDNEERRAKLRRERRDQTVHRLDTAQRTTNDDDVTSRHNDEKARSPPARELGLPRSQLKRHRSPAQTQRDVDATAIWPPLPLLSCVP